MLFKFSRHTHKRGKEKEEISLSHHLMSSFGVTLISALHEAYGAYVTFSAFKILFVMNPSISSNFSNNNFVLLLCLKRIFFVFEHFFALRCFLRKSRKSSSLKKSSSSGLRKNFVTQRTRAHMLRKIAQSSVSRHAQMRNALANGSMVRV